MLDANYFGSNLLSSTFMKSISYFLEVWLILSSGSDIKNSLFHLLQITKNVHMHLIVLLYRYIHSYFPDHFIILGTIPASPANIIDTMYFTVTIVRIILLFKFFYSSRTFSDNLLLSTTNIPPFSHFISVLFSSTVAIMKHFHFFSILFENSPTFSLSRSTRNKNGRRERKKNWTFLRGSYYLPFL